jgi:hypothetical protein
MGKKDFRDFADAQRYRYDLFDERLRIGPI